MSDKETMQNEVYNKVKDLKNRFYNAKTQDEWNQIKEDFKVVMAKAKELMTPDFYEKYNKGTLDAITKIYTYKEKQFNKAKFVAQPKQSYIFREDEGQAFIKLCETFSQFLEQKMSLSELG